MKTIQLFLILLYLLFLGATGYSQINTATPDVMTYDQEEAKRMMEREREIRRESAKESLKDTDRLWYWDNGGTLSSATLMSCLSEPELRAALSVSDEYYQEILVKTRDARDSMGKLSENPEYREASQELMEAQLTWGQAATGSPGLMGHIVKYEVDEETTNRVRAAEERVELARLEFDAEVRKRNADAFNNAITPELKHKLLEAQLTVNVVLGAMKPPVISPSMFEALNLTDAQRQQMEQVRNELAHEFEKYIEIDAERSVTLRDKVNDAIQRLNQSDENAHKPLRDQREEMQAIIDGMSEEPEYKKILEKQEASARAFAALYKARMFNILTDEQRSRLQELIDNPPLHVRIHVQRVKELLGESLGMNEEGKNKRLDSDKNIWVPGPDSWKPGDPLPEAYRHEKNTGKTFPREEN